MRLTDLPELLQEELDYPTEVSAVRDRVGSVEVEAPDAEDSRTIGELLDAADDETYGSADELFESILASLPDEYVGRKYYSDRGAHIDDEAEPPDDEPDQSV